VVDGRTVFCAKIGEAKYSNFEPVISLTVDNNFKMERRGRGRPPKAKRIVVEDDEMQSDKTVSEHSEDES
jgi:hypothetical protein